MCNTPQEEERFDEIVGPGAPAASTQSLRAVVADRKRKRKSGT